MVLKTYPCFNKCWYFYNWVTS